MSIITINVNGPSTLVKRHRFFRLNIKNTTQLYPVCNRIYEVVRESKVKGTEIYWQTLKVGASKYSHHIK